MLALSVTMLPTEGRTQVTQREADKAKAIKRIMAGRKFDMGPAVAKQSRAFCEVFLRDFRTQANIEYVEPVARADSYDDPVWEPYKRRCSDAVIFDRYECEPKIYDAIMARPPAERQREWKTTCRHYQGTANFKLFVVDLNNDPKDGKEQVFYYERAQGPLNRPDAKLAYGSGGYRVIDLDRCEVTGGANSHDPYSYFYKRSLDNYSGIVRYQGKHYVFDLYELDGSDRNPDNPHYRLVLNGYATYSPKIKPKLGTLCSFGTLVIK
jgi:hypothetical protein